MIFVTGGTGFLGRHLIAGLCRAGLTARVLTRSAESNRWLLQYPNVEVVEGDVRDAALIMRAIQGCHQVIHAAGLFSFWGSERDFQETNVSGTEHVMAAALNAGVERVVHISTVVVIGEPDTDAIDEHHPVRPVDPYQRSKLAAEQVVKRYHRDYGLSTVILRPGAFYGPYGNYAFNRLFFKDALRGLVVLPDGGHYVTFPVYIADVVQAALLALQRGTPGGTYNVCGDLLTHSEVFDIICTEASLRWPRVPVPGFVIIPFAHFLTFLSNFTGREPFYPINLRSVIFNHWRVSSEKARHELGFVPLDFREGARRTINWYRAGQPEMWWEFDCD